MNKKLAQTYRNPPTGAFILSLFGGIIILLNGLLYLFVNNLLSQLPNLPGYDPTTMPGIPALAAAQTVLYILAGIGIVIAAVIIYSSFMLHHTMRHHVGWGVVILVFSLVSIVMGGGFIAGLILGVIGGILALVWRPVTMVPAPA